MALTYFKRYRMEIDLNKVDFAEHRLPPGYRFVPWSPALVVEHAETKYLSFRHEIDANVFSCLGDYEGCRRLMLEISRKEGFLPEATWLIAKLDEEPATEGPTRGRIDPASLTYVGTVQGVEDRFGYGAIQNLGIVPEQRGAGLGSVLLLKALEGFRRAGLKRAFLEVTAQNEGAVRLYRKLGFAKARTVYKAVELMGVPVR
ncbi:MAG: GNAT family N-acetyltransferase [Pirellulales bacterium]